MNPLMRKPLWYVSNIGATQPTDLCSLISTFVFHFLESIIAIPDYQKYKILANLLAEQAGASLIWLQT